MSENVYGGMTLKSWLAWVDHWGAGESVPVTKTSLRGLLEFAQRAENALLDLREQALRRVPGTFPTLYAPDVAVVCDDVFMGGN